MDRTELIDRYRQGADAVAAALAGITDVALDRRPAADEWTPREIVHHLADSETRSYLRLRQLLAEPEPRIEAYDEARWARTPALRYDRPVASSLAVIAAVRAASAELLDSLGPHDWARAGAHDESERYSVEDWLVIYAAHAHDHAAQIDRARLAGA